MTVLIEPARIDGGDLGKGSYVIELDLAVEIEHGVIALLVPERRLLELGLRPALDVEYLDEQSPLAPLSLVIERPPTTVLLQRGEPIARLVFMDAERQSFTDDDTLDEILEPDKYGPLSLG